MKQKISLSHKLKAQFKSKTTKISDMQTPDKLEVHVTEKFRRDRGGTSEIMAQLDEEMRKI